MGLSEKERHRIYEEEKARIEARERIRMEKMEKEDERIRRWARSRSGRVLTILLLLGAVIVLGGLLGYVVVSLFP